METRHPATAREIDRRGFLRTIALGTVMLSSSGLKAASNLASAESIHSPATVVTPFYRIGLGVSSPNITDFCLDSLGGGQLGQNVVFPGQNEASQAWHAVHSASASSYRLLRNGQPTSSGWNFDFARNRITIRSRATAEIQPPPLRFRINQKANHATLLGMMRRKKIMDMPCLLHLPDFGTARITCSIPNSTMGYDARRRVKLPYVEIVFPAATALNPIIEYVLNIVALYPELPGIENNPRYDGFRRNFINIFQVNPRLASLANNASSDFAACCLYEYADVARAAPPLAEGLTSLHLVRMTLDRLIHGMKAYGLVGWTAGSEGDAEIIGDDGKQWMLDSYPAMLIAAAVYIQGQNDWIWAKENYPHLASWGRQMLANDHDGNGLIEHYHSGNTGSWIGHPNWRSSSWWDAVGFGHEDAYANAVAYRACRQMTEIARGLDQEEDASFFTSGADKIRAAYKKTFLNPATGLLAGWKSADGVLHDYAFTFVNSLAICSDLVDRPDADRIMDRLLMAIRTAGFTRFDLGLPGNLRPIPPADYVDLPKAYAKRCGVGEKADGSDAFQNYENGGATACWAYFTIKALFKLGRPAEARRILYPMLSSFTAGQFQGFGPNGMSKDWKNWSGVPYGYEGFLSDNYFTLLAVLDDRTA